MSNVNQTTTVDTWEYRRTVGLFATGVSILAVQDDDGSVAAMTANAVSSVSLDPTLLLVCVEKEAHIARVMLNAETFTLSFLSETQEPLSIYFARMWNPELPEPAFEFLDWEGGPRLAGTLGAIGCRRYDVLEGGDHWIFLGEVTHLYRADEGGAPLVYFGGQYRRLAGDD